MSEALSSSAAPAAPRVHPVVLAVTSMLAVQLGAGFAEKLMTRIGPGGAVMMRQGGAALVLSLLTRPTLTRSKAQWRNIVFLGLVFAVMNLTFYSAVHRLPLGVAVTIELLGPLSLSAALARKKQDLFWVLVAVIGVLLLRTGETRLDPLGVIFALIAAAGWASYILLSRRIGSDSAGAGPLALSMAIAAVVASPFALSAGSKLLAPRTLGLGLLVAMLGGLIPFLFDLKALRHIPPRVFGLLMSLSPAVASLSGVLVLSQRLKPSQYGAMVLVIIATAATVKTNNE